MEIKVILARNNRFCGILLEGTKNKRRQKGDLQYTFMFLFQSQVIINSLGALQSIFLTIVCFNNVAIYRNRNTV